MKQRTLKGEASITGKSLHTGQEVTLTLKPAQENSGITFRRVDVIGKPELRPLAEMAADLVRNTTIVSEHFKLHTVEHVLSALNGMGIDNAIVEMNASEPPIVDGSARPFVTLIHQAGGPVEQAAERKVFALTAPINITDGSRSIFAFPYDGLRITCTSADSRGFHTQHLSLDINPETYESQIAPARTFTIYDDIKPLLDKGLIQGGSLDTAIVIKDDKIVSKEPLRFRDEFVRHKILDILGDIVLAGPPIKAHIIAVCTGHALNAKLSAAIRQQWREANDPRARKNSTPESEGGKSTPPAPLPAPPAPADAPTAPTPPAAGQPIEKRPVVGPLRNKLNIRQILNLIPHRYPFVMLDRVVEVIGENELKAIKNISINEPFFQGHYPGNPIFPGVLQLEAMSQAAGLLMLRVTTYENKVCYFMSANKVKFRKAITPGDQVLIHAKLVKVRSNRIGTAECTCSVDGEECSSAEIMFCVADATAEP